MTDNVIKRLIFTTFQHANANFRRLLTESTERLKDLSKKLGACIGRARPYHEAVSEARAAQRECQTAALQFQRTSGENI
jgi:hypothetical protein